MYRDKSEARKMHNYDVQGSKPSLDRAEAQGNL